MDRNARVMRAIFVGAAVVFLFGGFIGSALLVMLQRFELDDLILPAAFGVPLVVGLAAGVWTYRRPETSALDDVADTTLELPPPAPRPRARDDVARAGRAIPRRRGPRSRRSPGL
jgi:hypothetical protein